MSGVPDSAGRPVAQVQQWVRDTCRELGLPVEHGSDDFFSAGGTSLTLLRLVARAEAEFGDDALPPDDLYEHSSFHGIAATIIRNSAAPAGSAEDATVPPPASV